MSNYIHLACLTLASWRFPIVCMTTASEIEMSNLLACSTLSTQEVLGMTMGRRLPGDKETWWWNDKVQEVIKAKKETKKIWDASRTQEDKDRYRQTNKTSKKAVATTEPLPFHHDYGCVGPRDKGSIQVVHIVIC